MALGFNNKVALGAFGGPPKTYPTGGFLSGGQPGRPQTRVVDPTKIGNMSVAEMRQYGDNPITAGDLEDPVTLSQFYQGPKFSNLDNFGTSPYASSLKSFIDNLDTSYSGGSYKARDRMGEALPEYDAMRTRLNQRYNRDQQAAQEGLDRKFAALGGGPSGASIKASEKLAGDFAAKKGEEALGIDAEEAQARRGLQETEYGREYESGEKARGYGFQGKLAGAEAKLGGYGTLANLDLAYKNAQKEALNDEFNKIMAMYQAKHSGGLLGGGGFLGTGIGA